MKEELLAREPWTAFQLAWTSTGLSWGAGTFTTPIGRERSLSEAQARLADKIAREARFAAREGYYLITEVRVRWAWVNGDCREEVFETVRECPLAASI